MRVVVLTNQKGGVGKSTLSVLLAEWLAERHRLRVGVIDLDTQANASKSLARFASGREAVEFFEPQATAAFASATPCLTLFAGTKRLADLELARPELILPVFRRQVTTLAESFDFLVIDTPPSLGLRMSAALIAATHVACPIELEEYSIDGVTDMLKTIFGIRRRYNAGLRLAGLLANRYNPHSVRQKAALHDLVAHYSEFVIPAKISTRSAIPEALAAGVPLWRLAKSSARDAAAEVAVALDLLMQRIDGVERANAVQEGP
ncbi:ParA family protein [Variovorax sp. J22R115]|uniref:ParA family protein n=1 Tax=Variovorax sp. J22R115 TaxID=3053509 RepID=UPI0025786332|nr:ParA family protein [Variovorax sp. J22R115]MDM0049750.1 ParA family protein [Variovorax sp. J22R115]